jgi:hypothetical protein
MHTIKFRTLTEGSNYLFRILLNGLERETVVSSAGVTVNKVRCTQGRVVTQKKKPNEHLTVCMPLHVWLSMLYIRARMRLYLGVRALQDSKRSYCRSMDMPAP